MYNDFYNQNMEAKTPVTAPYNPQPNQKKPKRAATKLTAMGLCCMLLGGGIVSGVFLLGGTADKNTPAAPTASTVSSADVKPTVVATANVAGKKVLTASEVYAANLNSVVGINGNVTTNVWGQTVSNAVSGSGFVISEDGYILTNYHVIKGVSNITVFFSDDTSYDATVVGDEEDNDIAVLKIDAKGLKPIVLGDSSSITVGENVYAIGNPLGELTFTLTGGLVSAKDRSVTNSDGTAINMIQTDTAINSGNSGGPLFDQYGQVIGVVSAKLSGSGNSTASVEGLGFAIPVNDVREMVTSIIENGYVAGKANLGVITGNVSATGLSTNNDSAGCQVLAVLDDSCAETSGLQQGDIITKVDDTEIASASELGSALREHQAGDTVTLTVRRSGETETLEVTLDEEDPARQEAMTQLQNQYQASWQMNPFFGLPTGVPGTGN